MSKREREQGLVRRRLHERLGSACLEYSSAFKTIAEGAGSYTPAGLLDARRLLSDTMVKLAFLGDANLRAAGGAADSPETAWAAPVAIELRHVALSHRAVRGLDRTRLFVSPKAIPVQAGIYAEMQRKRFALERIEINALDDETYAQEVAFGGIRLWEGRAAAFPEGPWPHDKTSGQE